MLQTTATTAPTDGAARASEFGAIDHWQPVHLLNEGHWTRVFLARPEDCSPDRPADYVLKVLKSECEADEYARRQIAREARVGQHVHHANLITVLGSRVESSPFHVVMPYLEGVSVGNLLLKDRALLLPQVLWIARQTAQALQAMHLNHWMHADVKPSNIMVSSDGHVTLIDLGFAQSFPRKKVVEDELVGTMNYAAPEIFIPSRKRNGLTDVYSLGVTLFEMLTGRLPFDEQDATELALAHLRCEPPDPRIFTPTLPNSVVRLLKKMLAKEPLRRIASDELVATLMELEIECFDQR